MPNSTLEKKWTRWYPKKIFLKNKEKNKKFLYNSSQFNKKDFFVDIDKNNEVDYPLDNQKSESTDFTKTKEYKLGFKKGFLESSQENILLKNKLNSFLLDLEKSFLIFQTKLFSRLLKTTLIVTSYVVGKKTDINESFLIQNIKKIIDQDGIFFKKPNLFVHPSNKDLIEKTFKKFLNTYKWKVVYDDNLELNSFQIKSENSNIDATSDARWKELLRLIDSEE